MQYDLIIIGAGPGGYVAAIRAAQLGMNVACIDKRNAPGGTCLNIGCIPSKALLESSYKLAEARDHLGVHGVKVSSVELDLKQMLARKDQVVKTLTGGVQGLLKKNKVAYFNGQARIEGKGKVTVASGKDSETLEGKNILIATGSVPATLPGIELDDKRIVDSTGALSFDKVPEHLVVIGGGYIGVELGSVWSRLGSKVTVLEYFDRILTVTDRELATEAQKLLEKQGMSFKLGVRVSSVKVKKNKLSVECEGTENVECDRVLVSVGRKPLTEGLGLENVGIETDKRGFIGVDHDFKAAEGVYAIGDVIGNPMLAHKAEEEGIACVEKLATGYGHVDYNVIPSVIYTHPEVASVGRTEDELKAESIAYNKGVFHFRANGRARSIEDTDGRVKVLADKTTDRVLGVHIIGPNAGELIAEAAAAMAFAASSEDIARVCHAHPTLAEAVKEAAMAVEGKPIHS